MLLKCSFGTSKYCSNFLGNGYCKAFVDGSCPFIHYLERQRDKVVEDDPQFKVFLEVQG